MTTPLPFAPRRARPVDLYYLVGTPVFALLDLFGGISIRAAFLDGYPAARYGYYGVCFACGLAAWRAPSKARLIAMTESSANIILFIFSVMLSYYAMIDQMTAEQPVSNLIDPTRVANLAIAATVLIVAYLRSHTTPPPV